MQISIFLYFNGADWCTYHVILCPEARDYPGPGVDPVAVVDVSSSSVVVEAVLFPLVGRRGPVQEGGLQKVGPAEATVPLDKIPI